MKPIQFPEVNVMVAENQPEYLTLPSYFNKRTGLTVNCWQLEDKEIASIINNRIIWIHHFTGGVLQPYNMVAVKDYFSSVIHQGDKFTINDDEEDDVDVVIENLINKDDITTPLQSFYIHMQRRYDLNLSDSEIFDIARLAKEI